MSEIEVFYELKNSVLEHYRKHYPYFEGNWKSFTSQDIANLIDDVFEVTKNSVSEKWIYTHLKKETNESLPRKDMLDIFAIYVGKTSWDQYKHQFTQQNKEVKTIGKKEGLKNKKYWLFGIMMLLILLLLGLIFTFSDKKKTIQLKEHYTNDNMDQKMTKAFVVKDSIQTEVQIENSTIQVAPDAKVVVKNPLYKDKIVDLEKNPQTTTVSLEPNDYAAILQGFIKSDLKDWQTRKTQLEKILDDNVEVIVMLKNNLGAEYFNKQEFAQKLIIPTPSLKQLQIVEVKNNDNDKIIFVRLIQE
jgi:hypothetical protein